MTGREALRELKDQSLVVKVGAALVALGCCTAWASIAFVFAACVARGCGS